MIRNSNIKSKIIHGSSIEINGKGVIILGKSGAGKSSLAIKLISLGANFIADDQTLIELKDDKLIISKPSTTPSLIEARGIGLIQVPLIRVSELFYFIKIIDQDLPRLPFLKTKKCFGKKINLLEFNPRYNNEAALFIGIKHEIKNNNI